MADAKKLYFTEEHEWVEKLTDDTIRIGVTEHAAELMGDIVFVEYQTGLDEVAKGDEVVTVESVKSVSEVYAPVSGTITKQNEALSESPETINEEAFEGGWMLEMRLSDPSELDALMSFAEYEAFVAAEEA